MKDHIIPFEELPDLKLRTFRETMEQKGNCDHSRWTGALVVVEVVYQMEPGHLSTRTITCPKTSTRCRPGWAQ